MEDNNKKRIILGLDISTTTIGCCLLLDDGSEYGKIIELTHVHPKVSSKIKGIESLFIKKNIFNDQFLTKWKDFGITDVVIEEPLLGSNNVETVGTLLRFNGMISSCIYDVLGIVPQYISSYDARKYSFPDLMSIRKYGKDTLPYTKEKLINSVKKGHFVLFGSYSFDIDKKQILQAKVSELFPDIEWLYNKKGELKKENFDASDAYVAVLGFLNKERNGELNFETNSVQIEEKFVKFNVKFWNKEEERIIYF